MIKGLIFDLDGVLTSTEHQHYEAWKSIGKRWGFDLTLAQNEALKGVSREGSLSLLCQWAGVTLDPPEFQECLHHKNAYYLQAIADLNQSHLLPGVMALLTEARNKHVLLGVGSSSKNARFILDKIGLTSFFDAIVDGNDLLHPKPDPEVFLKVAKALGLLPAECIVFEDALSGMQAAQNGGFACAIVGNPSLKSQAKWYLDSLEFFDFALYEEKSI
jgi:beta-phosphoglucomutase